MATDAVFAQLEVVSKNLPEFFGTRAIAVNQMKKAADVEMVSERDYRAPFLTQNGGRTGTFNPDGGAIGRGTAPKGGVFVQTAFPMRIAGELSTLMTDSTANAQLSRLNALKRTLKQLIPEMELFRDQVWHGDGTAVVGTATAHNVVSGKSVYTMDTVTACRLLRVGQFVVVYDSGLTTARNSGTAVRIEQIDYANRDVYLSISVGSAAATDKLAFDGSSGASPTGPNGLKYFHTTSTAGSTLGVTRATNLEVISNGVAVSGVPTFMAGQRLIDNMLERRKQMPDGCIWLASEKQKSNLYAHVQNISSFDLTQAESGLNADLNPTAKSMKFNYCGYKGMIDPHQDNDRMDLVCFSDWGFVRLKDIGFYEKEGQKIFTLYGADGSPAATSWMALYMMENYICRNPGNGGTLTGLTLPTY